MRILFDSAVLLAMLWLGAQLTACAHAPPAQQEEAKRAATQPPAPSIEAKQLAAEEQAPYVTEIKFAKGKRHLTTEDRKQLDKLVASAKIHGEVSDIKVVTWADEEYPSPSTKRLSDRQVKLAKRRNDDIKTYLQSLEHKANIDTYNMAERPGALSELFSTSNARIKKALEVSGIPNTDTSVKSPAKASRSIVMVILKD